jgi:hypothetical protein
MVSEPTINEWEKVATEQFAHASLEIKMISATTDKLGEVLCAAGLEPSTRHALGLLALSIGVLRQNNVAPRMIQESVGAFMAGALGGALREGGLPATLEALADIREARVKELLVDKRHTMLMEMDDDVVGSPMTVIAEHTRDGEGGFKLTCSMNFHPEAVDSDVKDKVPQYTLRTVALAVIAALQEAVADTPDPAKSN